MISDDEFFFIECSSFHCDEVDFLNRSIDACSYKVHVYVCVCICYGSSR